MSRAMKEVGIALLTLKYLLRYLGLWILMSAWFGWKMDDFGVSPLLIKKQIHAPIALVNACLDAYFTPPLVKLGSLTLTSTLC